MSDSVWPHKRQPTRLLCPWDSPGKKTGVGCHFLPQCMEVKSEREVAQSCPTLSDPMDCNLPGSSVHGIFQTGIPEWVAIPCSRGSSRPSDWTRISCFAGGLLHYLIPIDWLTTFKLLINETLKEFARWVQTAGTITLWLFFIIWCWRSFQSTHFLSFKGNIIVIKKS